MAPHVIVLGGGVAGMSAAHELIERGFRVTVYELKGMPGGKARSIPIHPTTPSDPPALPGEHGFRFFPRFYQHITDTMKRIPAADGKGSVFDHLTETSRIGIFQTGKASIELSARFPRTLDDLHVIFESIFHHPDLGLTRDDIQFFGERMWQLITSCRERRADEYEKIAWWDYIDAEHRSKAYQTWLATGISRSLVASKAEYANTKTDGDIMVQLLFDILEPGVSSDRVLDGPTSEVWLAPWLNYLRSKGVSYHEQAMVERLNFKGDVVPPLVESVTIVENGARTNVSADYYISALPVERMADLVLQFPEKVREADDAFDNILRLSKNVAWMNGLQFYLKQDAPLIHGHAIYIDSPWALTSISQAQFWPQVDLRKRGDGQVSGIISVDISDWGMWVDPRTREIKIGAFPGKDGNEAARGRFNEKYAFECTPDELATEVWTQMKASVNVDGKQLLPDNYYDYFLDPDIAITPAYLAIEDAGRLSFDQLMQALRNADVREPGHPDQPISAATVRTQVNWLLSYGLIQTQAEGDELYYVATNPAIIAWVLKQRHVSVDALAQKLNNDQAAAQQVLDRLVDLGFVRSPDILGGNGTPDFVLNHASNLEPLLVNLIDTWGIRPDARIKIPNLFLASDYVRTNTDLATMEGANEAARRAVNGIIGVSGVTAKSCRVWDLHEPWFFLPWRLYDLWRFKRGLPWSAEPPWLLKLIQRGTLLARDVLIRVRKLFAKKR